jgi:exopolysaccharide biosynthesis polyprenyl glycosylphosphotransferase
MTPVRRALLTVFKICDLAVVLFTFALAVAIGEGGLRPGLWHEALSIRLSLGNLFVLLGYLLLWHGALRACGLYRSYRLSSASRELRDLGSAAALALFPLAALGPLADIDLLGGPFLLIFAGLSVGGLWVTRRVLRTLGRAVRLYGRNLRNVVVIGTGDETLALTARLARRHDFGYQVVAVIDCGANGDPEDALSLVGALIDSSQIDEVFMTLALDTSQALIGRIVARCEEQGITVRLASQIASLYWARALVDEIDGQPIITVHTGPPDSLGLIGKRIIDVTGACIGLAVLAPLLLLCALCVRLDSAGPVFFRQERVGYHRRRFTVFKFRTMVADAEARQAGLEVHNEAEGPVFKIAADPRVTRVGRWLRRASIDELPQLLNVLRGDMSLVGPRPLPVRDVDRIDVRWHRRRFSVKPGITCLWQVQSRAPRFDEWIALDMQYIDNWSLSLDLKILARTIPAVLTGQGAH